ncbi:family 43 glycosylhydrolase [Microbacterium hatanonis]|uniref:Family 43 glycosylhydrolase n=1 Tax=Microbacterium hatanonis TaxID=404366 RepID=A0A5C8HWZ5_9MICO|nr:family 43 glycosylhydrolase [Microbacterium hatanonis]TXK09655.1 family 43 glycosylhydrolase [Microbacterium hatanonis]
MTRILCNPMDLEYRYQDIRFSGVVGGVTLGEATRNVHREAADPSLVLYQDRYFLFASMSRGFWHSADLHAWTYQATEKLPPFDYAPDVRVVNGALLISASRKQGSSPFFRSVDPLTDDFEEVSPGPFSFWDPSLFQDDDGRIYLYWGCDNKQPITGVELDDRLEPIGEPVELLSSDVSSHGWERTGENYLLPEPKTPRERQVAAFQSSAPYMEGAWMTRHAGRYYLQYAAPGTQFNTYADGYYTADRPLGPFTYSTASPFSSKPGGFAPGAGHGSTIQDRHGNWWHAATMRISVNGVFERRLGLFPAGFDADGTLTCNQNFGDYPFAVPDESFDPWEKTAPEWMLLSYRSAATASSSAAGQDASLAVNEDIQTWWAAAHPGAGEWVAVDLGAVCTVASVQVNLADHIVAPHAAKLDEGSDGGHTWRGIYREHTPAVVMVEGSRDGEVWETVHDGRLDGRDRPHALVTLDEPRELRHLRVTAASVPFDGVFAVSGLRVFGRSAQALPAQAAPTAVRVDPLMARVSWPAVPGAMGYNVRYGGSADRLYRSWLVYDQCDLDIRSLNADEDTWFAVDAFNGAGVTTGAPVPALAS